MSDELKNAKPIMVRLTPAQSARVAQASERSGLAPATLGRQGLVELAERLLAAAPVIDPETAALLANARARGLDVRALLTAALTNQLAAEAATQQPAA